MLSLLGFIAIIIATIYAYRTAKDYNRNAVGWAAIVFGVGFAIQIIIPLLFGIIYAVILLSGGSDQFQIQESINVPAIIVGIICLILSIIAMFFILNRIPKVQDETAADAPPPPTEFNL
jgi:MFS family permease